MHTDRYDALLGELHAYAPLYPKSGFNLANHAPMVLDALWELGADSHAEAWLSESTRDLTSLPHGNALGLRERAAALGDYSRAADWIATFSAELEAQGVERTLRVALPLLTPGVMAASLHGVLRTAHALRALSRARTPARLAELAHGLGTWAACYQLLPGLERPTLLASQRLSPLEWLAQGPLLPQAERLSGLLHEIVSPLASHEPWLDHLRRLGPVVADESALHAIAAWSAERLVLDPEGSNAHLHGVTVPSSLVWFGPWVERSQLDALARHVVLGLGAVHVASASDGASQCAPKEHLSPKVLVERALKSGDDHALKVTEAALRISARGLVDDRWLMRGAEKWVRRANARRAA
ncbi:MAG: hypothetical protein R3B07_33180 [Polyangiaceae bacterium]